MKGWHPHIDLARLSMALAEEVRGASEDEWQLVSDRSGYSIAGAAHEVRELIAAAAGDQSERPPIEAACLAALARQH
jgi:hypothetical protein